MLGSRRAHAGHRAACRSARRRRSTRRSRSTSKRSAAAALPGGDARRIHASRSRSTAATGWSMVQARIRPPEVRRSGRARRRRRRRCSMSSIRAVPAGSMGLTLQPYWSPGVRDPGPGSEGRDHRLRRRAHARACLPGDHRRASPTPCARARERTAEADGRAADRAARRRWRRRRATAAMQLTADVFGLPVGRPQTHEASGLGAAMRRGGRARPARGRAEPRRPRWCASARSAIRTPPRTRSTTSSIAASTPMYRRLEAALPRDPADHGVSAGAEVPGAYARPKSDLMLGWLR